MVYRNGFDSFLFVQQFNVEFCAPDLVEVPEPTLQDIIQADDDDYDLIDNLDFLSDHEPTHGSLGGDSLVKESSHTSTSLLRDLFAYDETLSHFNVTSLENINSQLLMSKNENVDSGAPTCLAASASFILIGTFNCHILVFGYDNKLKFFLKNDPDFGSISSISVNHDESKLVCCGSKGLVALWNLANAELIRSASDVCAPFSSIINLKFLSDPSYVLLCDTSGSVFLLDIRKAKSFDSKCIFTGSRGEVLTFQPLYTNSLANSAFAGIEEFCVVALATVTKVIVITVRPGLILHHTSLLKGKLNYLPFISWNYPYVDPSDGRHKPLLAYGRMDVIIVAKMISDFDTNLQFVPIFQFNLVNYSIQYACWFQNDYLFIVDDKENVHLIHVADQSELETLDLSQVQLIYESSHYKALVNGGEVSSAMAMAGEHACCNAFATQHGRMYVLGVNSLSQLNIRTWQERIEYFVQKNAYEPALALVCDELVKVREENKDSLLLEQVENKYEETFAGFQKLVFQNDLLVNQSDEIVRQIIKIYLKNCVHLKSCCQRITELYDRITSSPIAMDNVKSILIECLEEYIFGGKISALNPLLVTDMIEYYNGRQWYSLLDSIIPHLSISSLDIDFVVKMALDHHLFDSYIYIHNCAFHDFIGCFNDLVERFEHLMAEQSNKNDENVVLLGNKLLVYLSSMLTGVYFPNIESMPYGPQLRDHLQAVYSRITEQDRRTGRCQLLKLFIDYDCGEFFNVLLIALNFLEKCSDL